MFRNIRHKNAFGTPSYVELILNSYFQKSNLEHVLKTAIIFRSLYEIGRTVCDTYHVMKILDLEIMWPSDARKPPNVFK